MELASNRDNCHLFKFTAAIENPLSRFSFFRVVLGQLTVSAAHRELYALCQRCEM